jgi:hypothetical protein
MHHMHSNSGCLVGLDLAHAVGSIELRLHEWGVDFGFFCTYKYLSAGPGAVGGCFVHAKHTQDLGAGASPSRLAGWWGQRELDRFSFAAPAFRPAPGALGFQLSTPSPIQLAALAASLALFQDAGGMPSLRTKSELLTAYLEALLQVRQASRSIGMKAVMTTLDPSLSSLTWCPFSNARTATHTGDAARPRPDHHAPRPLAKGMPAFLDLHRRRARRRRGTAAVAGSGRHRRRAKAQHPQGRTISSLHAIRRGSSVRFDFEGSAGWARSLI